jgi:hypothetical protein
VWVLVARVLPAKRAIGIVIYCGQFPPLPIGPSVSFSRLDGRLMMGRQVRAGMVSGRRGLHAENKLNQRAIHRAAPTGTPPGRYKPPDTLLALLDGL